MIELNPDDPFDKVVINMVEMYRKKRLDYAADADPFSNFRDTSDGLGMASFGPAESAQVLLLTKVARLKSLRLNGRMANPSNESVLDTYLDLAVYATILLALVKEEGRKSDENAYRSAVKETSRPGPDNVRPGRSVTVGETEVEQADAYKYGVVSPKDYMAFLRSRSTDGAPTENNDDEDMQSMSSEFLD